MRCCGHRVVIVLSRMEHYHSLSLLPLSPSHVPPSGGQGRRWRGHAQQEAECLFHRPATLHRSARTSCAKVVLRRAQKWLMKKTILLKRAESSSRCVCGGGSGHLSLSLRDGGHVRDGPGGGRRVLSLFLAGPLALAGFALPSLPAVAAPVAEQAGARWLHAPDR